MTLRTSRGPRAEQGRICADAERHPRHRSCASRSRPLASLRFRRATRRISPERSAAVWPARTLIVWSSRAGWITSGGRRPALGIGPPERWHYNPAALVRAIGIVALRRSPSSSSTRSSSIACARRARSVRRDRPDGRVLRGDPHAVRADRGADLPRWRRVRTCVTRPGRSFSRSSCTRSGTRSRSRRGCREWALRSPN